MKYLKIFGITIAADILALFIGAALASSSSVLIRLISAVCCIGILICFLVSAGIKNARADLKKGRISGKGVKMTSAVLEGIVSSVPAIVSWIILYISHSTGNFDFYRWHKIINAYFLQIYNFIEPNASTSSLSSGEILAMLPLVIIPFISYMTPYLLVCKKIIPESDN